MLSACFLNNARLVLRKRTNKKALSVNFQTQPTEQFGAQKTFSNLEVEKENNISSYNICLKYRCSLIFRHL